MKSCCQCTPDAQQKLPENSEHDCHETIKYLPLSIRKISKRVNGLKRNSKKNFFEKGGRSIGWQGYCAMRCTWYNKNPKEDVA
ncbi:MAG: hypothetical protein KatS3mg022_3355 [Armatimonadota bacterium]|nr:MAG: hypothetical protein KatS3mg022_3355 [Armatimonadota bacterium]